MKLKNAPIVEAVVDIDCDIPVSFNLADPEPFLAVWGADYPQVQALHAQQFKFEAKSEGQVNHEICVGIVAQQFRNHEANPVIQARKAGFSFNRLAPYTTLDDYLPEIRRTWELYRKVVKPLVIRSVRLKYINRLLLSPGQGNMDLKEYFEVCPHLPGGSNLAFTGFFHQHAAVEKQTDHTAEIILLAQPVENDHLPVIFDITVTAMETEDPENWTWISQKIELLRKLKQSIFENSLTAKCLKPYQH